MDPLGGGTTASIADRVDALDWDAIGACLWSEGYARAAAVLSPGECEELAALYLEAARFRSRVDMARYRFGRGEYQYFDHPLPPLVQALRERAYPPLARIANEWMEALGARERFPGDLAGLLGLCRRRGQTKPTPLLLRYESGGFNCLHQDLYGEVVFPLQLTCFLSRPEVDYSGGEFLLVEQRPRAQSRAEVVLAGQGDLVVFPTRHRPVRGTRGYFRASVRHGVSRVRAGSRYTLGIIFHDAT